MGVIANELRAYCDWQMVAIFRAGMALVFAAALARVVGAPLVLFGSRVLWLRSLAGSLSMVCTFYAYAHLHVSDVLTLTHMFPIWVGLLSWPLLGEAPGRGVWLAILCAVAGVAIIQQSHVEGTNLPTLAAAAASFFTALAMLGLHRLRGLDTRAIVVHFSGVALVFCVASFFVFERDTPPARMLAAWPLLLLLGLGLFATVGQIFLTKAFAHGSPTRVSIVGLTQVVFGLALELGLQGKEFRPHAALGSVLVMLPTAWVIASRFHGPEHATAEAEIPEPATAQVCEPS
jgi:drug/metabolite transporter (DMT)-like permease